MHVKDRSVVGQNRRHNDFTLRVIRAHEFMELRKGALLGGLLVGEREVAEGRPFTIVRGGGDGEHDHSSTAGLVLPPGMAGGGGPILVYKVIEYVSRRSHVMGEAFRKVDRKVRGCDWNSGQRVDKQVTVIALVSNHLRPSSLCLGRGRLCRNVGQDQDD